MKKYKLTGREQVKLGNITVTYRWRMIRHCTVCMMKMGIPATFQIVVLGRYDTELLCIQCMFEADGCWIDLRIKYPISKLKPRHGKHVN